MFDEYNICPYTGLRSFTEDESIYFKGRDEHIEQATNQLAKNKFLMLTGASGDGKSSLVYAGIIPNARSGFLKATYSNWQVVDFRPERSPLQNLSNSVAAGLGIENIDTIKAELGHGFSALTDLYKSSKRFIDETTNEWQVANDDEKAALTRDAANLIILADQFEEFFTNPENYLRGVPSTESALVLNLLLETARIALDENLPIYVVFTMRSDYIGQCAAFRGLPEYIGFSQFFVPRMNRKQLQEVIEEPAVLSGNKITRRLTERLIEDITDGTDQLPMLQHALNQIWKMADSGKEELDLIHYAMVGGLASAELPDTDHDRFVKWFDNLPEKIKICYDEAGLQNVLNTHANKLKNHAADYIAENTDTRVADEDAKLIIQQTFKCLTKINEGRAVRNRMTLAEITRIINLPNIDERTVNLVLNVYRDSTNTLVKPFIGEEKEGWEMSPSDVLDITHESLIRNWSRLKDWADEELDDYTIFLDFQQQLQRWIENEHSADFLLSIGPLTYFEEWFKRKSPNKYWIARYEADDSNYDEKLAQAAIILADAKAFIKSSSNKHFVTRTVMKYGPRRIITVIAILGALIFSSFSLKTYLDRRNSSMRKFLVEESRKYGNDPLIYLNNSSVAFVDQIRLGDLDADGVVDLIVDYKHKANMATAVATQMLRQAADASEPNMLRLLTIADSILTVESAKPDADFEYLVSETNDLQATAILCEYTSPQMDYEGIIDRNSKRAAELLKNAILNERSDFGAVSELNDLIEYCLNAKVLSDNDIDAIIARLSPFSGQNNNAWVLKNYAKPELYRITQQDFGFNYNGLYQELAYLYAARGNSTLALQAIDTLLVYKSTYPRESYMANVDNAINVAQYFISYGYTADYQVFIDKYCKKDGITLIEYYQNVLASIKFRFYTFQKVGLDGIFWFNRNHNANIDLLLADDVSALSSMYRKEINSSSKSADEKNFLLALSYKDEGIILAELNRAKGRNLQPGQPINLFTNAIVHYQKVSSTFLNEPIPISGTLNFTRNTAPRKFLFLYPDQRDAFRTSSLLDFPYRNIAFVDFLIDQKHFNKIYDSESLGWIAEWISEYQSQLTSAGFIPVTQISYDFEHKLLTSIKETSTEDIKRFSLLNLMLGNNAGIANDYDAAAQYYSQIDMEVIFERLRVRFSNVTDDIMRRIAYAVRDMSENGHLEIAYGLIDKFENPINRSELYAFAAKEGILKTGNAPYINQLIDSAYAENDRVKNEDFQPNRNLIAAALAFRNESGDIEEAHRVIKNENLKSIGIWWISRGLAYNNELYAAYAVIPDNLSDDDICGYLYEVYHDFNRDRKPTQAYWQQYEALNDNADARIQFVR